MLRTGTSRGKRIQSFTDRMTRTAAATRPSTEHAVRNAALVACVWMIAALPFVLGVATCPTARLLRIACPGCGMTRALHLLVEGDVRASLAMHALAVPTALSHVALAVASLAVTLRFGVPWSLLRPGWGRLTVTFVVLVAVADLVFWGARSLGAFGGPVPV